MMNDPGMESFFACSPHAVAALGPGGTVLRVNPAFTDLFGYKPEESEGANLDDLIAFGPEHGEACMLTHRMENGESFDFRAIRRRKGGAPVHVRCLGIRSAPGEGPVVDYAIYEDLDCARREEDTPSDDAACLEALFSGSPYAVAFVGSRGIVRQVNGEFEKLFGYVSGEAVGQSLDDLVVPEPCREEAERLTRRGDDGGKYRVETERRRKDGTSLPVLVYNVKPRTGKGEDRDFVI